MMLLKHRKKLKRMSRKLLSNNRCIRAQPKVWHRQQEEFCPQWALEESVVSLKAHSLEADHQHEMHLMVQKRVKNLIVQVQLSKEDQVPVDPKTQQLQVLMKV